MKAPEGYDISQGPLTYGTALAGAVGHLFPNANLLPPELRVARSKAMYVPTAALGILLVLGLGGMALYGNWEDKKFQAAIEQEIKKLEPAARRPMAIEREITQKRQRAQMIDNFRRRTGADLEVLNELTKLIQPPGWVMNALGGMPETIDPMVRTASKVLALSALRLLEDGDARKAARDEFETRTGGGIGGAKWIPPLCHYPPPIHFRWPEYVETPRGRDWWIPTQPDS